MAENVLPPYSNTGAVNTSEQGLRACVDWFQATFTFVQDAQKIIDVLGLKISDFTELDHGQFGYKSGLIFGNITVFYDGKPEMGSHLILSGQGCRQYEALGLKDWAGLIEGIFRAGGHFTRLDLAIDDFQGYFKIPTVVRKIKDGLLCSKFKSAVSMEKINIRDGDSRGVTIYYGSAASRLQVRMYEKRKEREEKGHDVIVDTWNRTELQMRDERAETAATLITTHYRGLFEIVAGILGNYLRFLNRGKDTNKSRWKTAKWWTSYLQDVEKLKLSNVAPDQTIEKTDAWLHRQVSSSMAMLAMAYEGNTEFMRELIHEGYGKLNKRQMAVISEYKKRTALQAVNMDNM